MKKALEAKSWTENAAEIRFREIGNVQKSMFRLSLLGLGVMVLTLTTGLRSANAQFLEKLEAAVRARLEASQSAQTPPSNPQGSSAQSSDSQAKVSSGELPPPSPQPASEVPLPSILETDENVVPPPAGTAADSRPASGQIYLGLEAEASVGGGLGVRVSAVTEGSPAWKAGFKVGDRIKAVSGNAISDLDGMVEALSTKQPGDTVRFFVSRGARNLELVTVLMDANLANRIASKPVPVPTDEPAWLGITVNDLTPSFRQQFGLSVFRGAAVTNVVPGSPAARGGIMAGDAIIEVAGSPIESADDLLAWMEKAKPGDLAQLRVARGLSVQSLVLTIESSPGAQLPMRFGNRGPSQNSSTTAQRPATLDLVPSVATPEEPVADSSAREKQLEAEVERLRDELRQTKLQLSEAERKLKDIVDALNRD